MLSRVDMIQQMRPELSRAEAFALLVQIQKESQALADPATTPHDHGERTMSDETNDDSKTHMIPKARLTRRRGPVAAPRPRTSAFAKSWPRPRAQWTAFSLVPVHPGRA